MDSSAPFAEAPPDTPWGALTATLAANGILKSNAADLLETSEPSDCRTLGDLLLPPDGGGDSADPAPLLLVLVSGSWCAPCRNFTPVLSSVTPVLTSHNVTTLFCSACADLDAFRAYRAKMPPEWRALPFDEDGEDDRDDLMERLGARSLPTLVVMDPVGGRVLAQNAVMEVQAGGVEGIGGLIDKWKGMAARAANSSSTSSNSSGEGGAPAAATTTTTAAAADDEDNNDDDNNDDDDESLTLRYTLPSSPGLICQYFRTQLLSPHLPEALSSIVLRREPADADPAAVALAETLRTAHGPGERWLFRTAAPALPVNSWGGSLGFEAGAVECWEVERDAAATTTTTNGKDAGTSTGTSGGGPEDADGISRAVVTIENETGRLLLVFRETIVMERSAQDHGNGGGGGCEVTKTLNLDGVPSMAHGPFLRRWKRESEAIFHALLGTCDRKKMMMTTK